MEWDEKRFFFFFSFTVEVRWCCLGFHSLFLWFVVDGEMRFCFS